MRVFKQTLTYDYVKELSVMTDHEFLLYTHMAQTGSCVFVTLCILYNTTCTCSFAYLIFPLRGIDTILKDSSITFNFDRWATGGRPAKLGNLTTSLPCCPLE